MKFNQISTLAVLVAMLTGAVGADSVKLMAKNALTGKWKATIIADESSKQTTDNLTFKNGKFTSENQQTDGFEPADFEEDPGPQGIGSKFSVTLTNKAGDTAKWSGFSTGSDIDGTLVITKKDGTATTFTFKAAKG